MNIKGPFTTGRTLLLLLGLLPTYLPLQGQFGTPAFLEKQKADFQEIHRVLGKMEPLDSLSLLEGLPLSHTKKALLEADGKKKYLTLEKFLFYRKPMDASMVKKASLFQAFKKQELFIPYRAPKLCEGFHPDYCLEVKKNEKTAYLLVCFGCHEVKLLWEGPPLQYDMARGTDKILKDLIGILP